MPTPLINPIRVQGGTFYSFSSAVNDIQQTWSDDNARFVFSKFVLLNLPDIKTPTNNHENFIVWEGIGASYGAGTSSVIPNSDPKISLAESFQNYVLNFEELILNSKNTAAIAYDPLLLRTVSERIFWKWLTQINAIRFRPSNSNESNLNLITEESPSSNYKNVVKYIGDINIVNNVSRGGDAYTEAYMHVPSTHGTTPTVLWKVASDENYKPNSSWAGTSAYIDGRTSNSVHPSGLSLQGFFDYDDNMQYKSGTTFGNTDNISVTAGVVDLLISQTDGVVLDFNENNYKQLTLNNLQYFAQFNELSAADDFEFNAVLMYYDSSDATNPTEKVTNAYGLLILDDFIQDASVEYLKRYKKNKPNVITQLNGNSYSLKLDIKFDSSIGNAGVINVINEYSTVALDNFTDAIAQLQISGDLFVETEIDNLDIKSRLTNLENFYFSQQDLSYQIQRLDNIEKLIQNAKISLASPTIIFDLITNINKDIRSIITGKLTSKLTYDTDVFVTDTGLKIDKTIPGQVKINALKQGIDTFSVCKNTNNIISIANGNGTIQGGQWNNVLTLGPFTNYFKHISGNSIDVFENNLIINIEDNNNWIKGQTFRFVFAQSILLNGYKIIINTDFNNTKGNGVYQTLIGEISESDLSSNKPIFEIICTDENEYTFNIDIIK